MSVFITNPYDRLNKSLELVFMNFKDSFDPGKGFFLKPNIVFPVRPDSGEITPPGLVKAVITAIRNRFPGNPIVLGEGTAAGTVPEENFRESGYRELASQEGVTLLDLDSAERTEIPWKYGTLSIPTLVYENNYINLPILKLSAAAVISGAMKNQKGLLTPEMKKRFHRLGLHEPLAELTRVVKPRITILDGSNFFRRNLLISGDNVVNIDRVAANLLNVEAPEYFRLAKAMGLGSTEVAITGYDRVKPRGNRYVHPAFKKFLKVRLWSNPRACSMCRMQFQRIRKFPMSEIGDVARAYGKLAKYAVFGADFVFGANPVYDPAVKRVICIGDCTAGLAREFGYVHVPGCPPPDADIMRKI